MQPIEDPSNKSIQKSTEELLSNLPGNPKLQEIVFDGTSEEEQEKYKSKLKAEENFFEEKSRKHQISKLKIELKVLKQNYREIKERNRLKVQFSYNIFTVVCLWLFFTLVIFVAAGKKTLIFDSSVLIAFITSTLTAVVFLLRFVLTYLFGPLKQDEKESK